MPQFNPEFFATQLFWLLVTFSILYLLMATVALPQIGKVLEDRQRRIEESLSKAGQLKGEAEEAVRVYETALADARRQAAQVVRERSELLAKEAAARSHEQGVRLAQQIKAGEARIAEAKVQALAGVREVALEVATATITRLIGLQPDQAQLEGAVTDALKEFGQ